MFAAQIRWRNAFEFVIARSEATWQSRSTQPDNRVLPANTAALRDGASRTPPPTRRVRSAGIPGNLQLPKALTERRYRRNRLVRFYRHLVRTGSAFPRLPRRFAPRNDNSGAFAISTMVRSFRRCSAGHGCPLPRNYNTWSAASRSFPLSIFSLSHVPFLKNQFQTRCVLGGAQRVFSGKMTVLRHFSD